MPKNKDIQSILIIGSGPIVIGQACEFDYSGSQAAKALKKEGYRVILVNSNPATIMTDPEMADATYSRLLKENNRTRKARCSITNFGRSDSIKFIDATRSRKCI